MCELSCVCFSRKATCDTTMLDVFTGCQKKTQWHKNLWFACIVSCVVVAVTKQPPTGSMGYVPQPFVKFEGLVI